MENEIKCVSVDVLSGVMMSLESAEIILEDVHSEFFDSLDPNNETALGMIAYEMPRAAARSNAVAVLLSKALRELRRAVASAAENTPLDHRSKNNARGGDDERVL